MKLIKCDRCGKVNPPHQRILSYNVDTVWWTVGVTRHTVNGSDFSPEAQSIDLCGKCSEGLEALVIAYIEK